MKNPPFQIGDYVTCSFIPLGTNGEVSFATMAKSALVVRRVTAVYKDGDAYSSPVKVTRTGWLVSADGGNQCPCCQHQHPAVPLVDSGYFTAAASVAKPTPVALPSSSAADAARKAFEADFAFSSAVALAEARDEEAINEKV